MGFVCVVGMAIHSGSPPWRLRQYPRKMDRLFGWFSSVAVVLCNSESLPKEIRIWNGMEFSETVFDAEGNANPVAYISAVQQSHRQSHGYDCCRTELATDDWWNMEKPSDGRLQRAQKYIQKRFHQQVVLLVG